MCDDTSALAQALRAACTGEVLCPDDSAYDARLSGYVAQRRRRPKLVLCAATTADIVQAVRCAAEHRATVGVFATGHGSRAMTDPDLMISTSALRELRIDPAAATATVAAGVQWSQVVSAAAPFGLAPVRGSHATVGAIGYTLGGGLGALGRRYGFAADHVRSFEIVTAAGEQLRVSDTEHPELFWALRGGGREGFGIVTEMTIALVPVDEVYGGEVYFDVADAQQLFTEYAAWAVGTSDDLTSSLSIVRVPDSPAFPEGVRGTTGLRLELCHVGDKDHAARECSAALELARVRHHDLGPRPFSSTAIDAPPGPGWGGALGLREVSAEMVETLLDCVGPQREAPFFFVELRRLGGALRGEPGQADAVAGREAEFLLFLVGAPIPELIAQAIPSAAAALFDRLAPWSTPFVPTNFADHLGASARDRSRAPEVRQRLEALRATWDPRGMFQHWRGPELHCE